MLKIVQTPTLEREKGGVQKGIRGGMREGYGERRGG